MCSLKRLRGGGSFAKSIFFFTSSLSLFCPHLLLISLARTSSTSFIPFDPYMLQVNSYRPLNTSHRMSRSSADPLCKTLDVKNSPIVSSSCVKKKCGSDGSCKMQQNEEHITVWTTDTDFLKSVVYWMLYLDHVWLLLSLLKAVKSKKIMSCIATESTPHCLRVVNGFGVSKFNVKPHTLPILTIICNLFPTFEE